MMKKVKIEKAVSWAGKTAKDLFENAVQAVDQNDDGKFDLADVAVVADSLENTVKLRAQSMKENAAEKNRQRKLNVLQPIFIDSLDNADFSMSKFIRIVERDKKRADDEVCQGSIGYRSTAKGLNMVNIFQDSIEVFGLTFYPDCDCGFYYADPSARDQYIALDDYFSYLKIARINELQKIAQALGAKHFRVTFKEEQATFSKQKAHVKVDTKAAAADADRDFSEKKFSTVEIAAEMQFPGHAPIKPQLKYLQRDPSIQALVSMRLDENAPLLHQKYMLKLSNSSGMKETDAMKIDAVLKVLKCTGNATVESEAKNESRRYLEYDIEF